MQSLMVEEHVGNVRHRAANLTLTELVDVVLTLRFFYARVESLARDRNALTL